MWKRILLFLLGIILLLTVIPVVLKQFALDEKRSLVGVELDDESYLQITFKNVEQNINLAGMLFLPEKEGPYPAVVVIHGAGTSFRENKWYLTFTSYLRENGIAVLLPDKRGSELSEGDWRKSSFQDLASDTKAAVMFLRDNYSNKISHIGVLGASQGGQVAPIVASEFDEVSYVINIVGSAVPFYDALVYEENNNLRSMGFLPGISNAIAIVSSWVIRSISQKEFWDSIGNYDPLPYWGNVDKPALVMLGELDTNVPTQWSANRLNALRRNNIQVVVFEGSGHPLEDPVGKGNSMFRSEARRLLREFIFSSLSK